MFPILGFNNSAIEAAIKAAELRTSGEIRVCVERRRCTDIEARAQEVFRKLGMNQTDGHNGVLLYVHLHEKRIVVLGDYGINEKIDKNFWALVCSKVSECFSHHEMTVGVVLGIMLIGEQLALLYPAQSEFRKNELPDHVASGDHI